MQKQRLDSLMVERGLAQSREVAKALVMAGDVLLNGQKAQKPGQQVGDDAVIELQGRAVALRQPRRAQA